MSTTCIPNNYTPLNPNEFRFMLHSAPNLSFEVQVAALPSLNLPSIDSPTPFTNIRVPGEHIDWEELSVDFIVDQNLSGWIEMYSWMRGIGFSSSFNEYVALRDSQQNKNKSTWEAITSDISVFTCTAHRNANMEYHFTDAFPVFLSAPTLSTTNEGQPIQTAKCRFAYTLYDVTPILIS